MYPQEYFSHPRIASFCHRTRIWRECDSLAALSLRLSQLLSPAERLKFEKECDVFKKIALPSLLDIYDPRYPPLLREIYDPPLVLSYLGNVSVLKNHLIAIVGTRKASQISMLATKMLVLQLKEQIPDLGIVSGLALGIDRRSFEVAMSHEVPVLGILGTSISEEYPPGNRDLYKQMKSSAASLLLSEFIFPTEPARWTFPKRNRLISGLVSDVYIMESGKKSGTLSTAMSALSQNREIHVFDHDLQFDNEGGKHLLGDGAEKLDWEFLAEGKGIIETPNFFGDKKLSTIAWKTMADKEREYKRQKNITPLGRGAYFVEFI